MTGKNKFQAIDTWLPDTMLRQEEEIEDTNIKTRNLLIVHEGCHIKPSTSQGWETSCSLIQLLFFPGAQPPFSFIISSQTIAVAVKNSCLQSLLNNEEFIRDVSRQETLWRAVPEAQLLRRLIDIRDCHNSRDYGLKKHRLKSFKEAFSKHVPEYKGSAQKDAHEFLSLFLNEVKSLSPHLKRKAALLGRSYTCPVEDHHVFKMENMRTCKSCGHQSSRQEEFTSLSLDLVPEGSVEDMLGTYLKEQKIEFTCDCGGTTSEVKSSFDTLPRVLIFHLKRFGFTKTHKLQKVNDPVRLQRDLVVSSKQGDGRYGLISIISHYGGTESGKTTDLLQTEMI
ncbi:ubiquitin carboxyl-terminal hydrolase 37-like [Simochromis diagramma]|uniref:ubiquitin carboxyl-terminal hydrolase 37-like n=1 Tax=Simochromis diagramma TaxID=43689 RepID=UPI001A7E49C5|nr:ubiquitin carboxyl-terminal hydrolase 37-like [Simochromis diagramma]